MRQKETVKLNSLMNKLGLTRGVELNRRIYNNNLLFMGISPFDVMILDDVLTEKGLLKDGTSLSEYIKSKLSEEEEKSFLILFGLD